MVGTLLLHDCMQALSAAVLCSCIDFQVQFAFWTRVTCHKQPFSGRSCRVLTVVCNAQNCWVSGLLSIVRISKYKKTQRFGNWVFFRPQAKGGGGGSLSCGQVQKHCSSVFPVLSFDRLCGLVVRVPGYKSRGPRFDSRALQKKSSGSGTGSTQPREYNWGATW
jgi:hypothetical protein